MKIIYLSSMCSKKKYADLFSKSKSKPGQAVMKYHRLLSEGIANVKCVQVKAYSILPITRKNCDKRYIAKSTEKRVNLRVEYLGIINYPLIKNLYVFFQAMFSVLRENNYNSIILCDALNNTMSIATVLLGKIFKFKTMAIVTDIPGIMLGNNKYSELAMWLLKQYDSYLFLTEQMNDLFNKGKRPYIVQEGYVDWKMCKMKVDINRKHAKKVVMYTGTIDKAYGIKLLVEAFLECKFVDAELHVYGSGDYEKELRDVCKNNDNVKYFGLQLIEVVVREQTKADLLVNPRFTNEDYTKYSFPSKNMEYMVSGTPVLTTRLPGMPKEYENYVYFFEDETLQGFEDILRKVVNKSREELCEKGKDGKEFVLREKNNICQAKKLVEFIKKEMVTY